ncbi:hypothetical protein AAUPMC_15975 [Pasteurella multocida subsp. multocida str. Anand1_cattle]|nr:hypothetical protein AAUPMC_15975 [Pasteurella multocida subsp. multocida str. Anand1_cattle]
MVQVENKNWLTEPEKRLLKSMGSMAFLLDLPI